MDIHLYIVRYNILAEVLPALHDLVRIAFVLIGKVIEADRPRGVAVVYLHQLALLPLQVRVKDVQTPLSLFVKFLVRYYPFVHFFNNVLVVLAQAIEKVELVQEFKTFVEV